MKYLAVMLLVIALAACQSSNSGTKNVTLKTVQDSMSYSIGTQIVSRLPSISGELNIDALLAGARDVLQQKDKKISDENIQSYARKAHEIFRKKEQEKLEIEGKENKTKGEAFLTENKTKEGVETLPSGLQYKILKKGTGKSPKQENNVVAHYKGTFADGKQFDSSYHRKQPATFQVTGVIKGWTEALQLMKIGSKWELYIPYDLAYGPAGRPPTIPPYSMLIFEIELLEIK